MKKKGCLYWLCIGWWLEPILWITSIPLIAIYWLFIAWWWNNPMLKFLFYATLIIVSIAIAICSAVVAIPFILLISVISLFIKTMIRKFKYRNINLNNMNGSEFEYFCSDLLKDNEFKHVTVTKGSGDHGIDILASKSGKRYAIQCKRYSSNVGNSAVQEAYSGKALYNADIAVVMSNSNFTKQAVSDAEKLDVSLWDKNDLSILIDKANSNTKKKLFSINSIGKTQRESTKPAETMSDASALAYGAMCEKYMREQEYMEKLGIDQENKNK